jgi:hypothetical protein
VRKPCIGDQGERAFGQHLPLLLGPAVGIAGQIGQRGLAAALGGDVGQRLQKPVHQRAALQGAGTLHEGFGRPHRVLLAVCRVRRPQQTFRGNFGLCRRQQPGGQQDRRRRG